MLACEIVFVVGQHASARTQLYARMQAPARERTPAKRSLDSPPLSASAHVGAPPHSR